MIHVKPLYIAVVHQRHARWADGAERLWKGSGNHFKSNLDLKTASTAYGTHLLCDFDTALETIARNF
jgi:hypothetical protein